MLNAILAHGWPFLVSVSIKSLFVLALAALAALALRRASAAARHLAWSLGIFGLLVLFALALLPLPATWQVPLWPQAALIQRDAPVVVPSEEPLPTGKAVPATALGRNGKGLEAMARHAPTASLPRPFPGREGTGRLRPGLGLWGPGLGLWGPGLGLWGPGLGLWRLGSLWPVLLFALWLVGALLILLPTLIGLVAVARLARQSPRVADGPLPALLASLARDLGVTWPVRLLLGDMTTPMTWGWLRPVILLPQNAEEWPEDRLRAVLLHELAHIARADWPAQMAAQLACALYWWNPCVWLAARQARLESERACDDRVLLAGVSASDYARHLLDIARSLQNNTLGIVVPMAQKSTVESRLRSILQPNRKHAMLTRKTLTVASLATLAVLVPLASTRLVARANAHVLATAPVSSSRDVAGITIQLAGVTEAENGEERSKPWWGVSGQPFVRSLLDFSRFTVGPSGPPRHGGDQGRWRVFAFRVTSPDEEPVTLEFQPLGSNDWSSPGSWPGKMAGSSQATEAQIDKQNGGYRLLFAAYPSNASVGTVRVGVGTGPWREVHADLKPSTNSQDITFEAGGPDPNNTCAFSAITWTKIGSAVTVSLTSKGNQYASEKEDVRLVAIDNQGYERLPVSIGDHSSGSEETIHAQFALKPSAIQTLRVETRPYRWVTFRNVALNPVNG